MSWNLGFWCGAFIVMGSIVVTLTVAVRAAIRGDVERHVGAIRLVLGIIVGFVLAYLAKVIALGREDKQDWTTLDLVVLYTHELLILTMLVSGLVAALRGRGVRAGRAERADGWADERRRHAMAGRVCYAAAWLAFATGGAVLARMFVRAM